MVPLFQRMSLLKDAQTGRYVAFTVTAIDGMAPKNQIRDFLRKTFRRRPEG